MVALLFCLTKKRFVTLGKHSASSWCGYMLIVISIILCILMGAKVKMFGGEAKIKNV